MRLPRADALASHPSSRLEGWHPKDDGVGRRGRFRRCRGRSAIRFLERTKIDLSPIQTHDFALGDAVKAFDLGKQSDKCIKVTLFNS